MDIAGFFLKDYVKGSFWEEVMDTSGTTGFVSACSVLHEISPSYSTKLVYTVHFLGESMLPYLVAGPDSDLHRWVVSYASFVPSINQLS